jgi:hypothetical protein
MSMRAMVLGVYLLGVVGTGIELFFLKHTTGISQLIPIVLLVMSLLVLAWHALERKTASLKTFQITMLLFIGAGLLGTVLHYRANQGSVTGKAPALAPGTMIQLGLLGLIYTFRHPALEHDGIRQSR